MAGMGPDIYMRHPAPVKDNSLKQPTINQFILTSTGWVLGGFWRGLHPIARAQDAGQATTDNHVISPYRRSGELSTLPYQHNTTSYFYHTCTMARVRANVSFLLQN
jgi:hypothetical protein